VTGSNDFCAAGPRGRFCNTNCSRCAAGSFAPVVGSRACRSCPRNHFSGDGAAQCSPCPPGSSTNGSSGASSCQACPSGWYNDAEGSDCKQCPYGSFSKINAEGNLGSRQCVECISLFGSFFQPDAGQDRCIGELLLNTCVCDLPRHDSPSPLSTSICTPSPLSFFTLPPSHLLS
jgi:hypothetical protein